MKAAGELLAEKGLYAFHVHQVAARAGFGKPLVYRYFGNRNQLLDALALAKASEVRDRLKNISSQKSGTLSDSVYRQILFARLLASDEVLQGVFRAQLVGELGEDACRALDGLIPVSGKGGLAACAEAFLLAGISYVLLLRNSQPECAGVPIATPKDLASFERAFIRLSSEIEEDQK